tara:strand:+ start:579 stop:884 length:306 start_codon:yes stop_codon:yes gene_type:complete
MVDFDVSKIILVLVFLGILVVAQVILKRRKLFGVVLGKSVSWPLKIASTLPLSKFASATVVECADLSFLVVSGKNGNSTVLELPKKIQLPASDDVQVGLDS